jgi:hypothetical protein
MEADVISRSTSLFSPLHKPFSKVQSYLGRKTVYPPTEGGQIYKINMAHSLGFPSVEG